jgi:hypothetical protein
MTMAQAKARTLSDFRAAHDRNVIIPNKIRSALAAMEKEGTENWETEAEFLKRAALSVTDLAMFRDQFEKHWIEIKVKGNSKRIWFGTIKAAAAARG